MRLWIALLAVALCAAPTPKSEVLRGKLMHPAGKPASVLTAGGKLVELDGDEATRGVLKDRRLSGFEIEARGRYTAAGRFLIDPIHTRALFVFQNGRARMVTYWCELCAIRTYTPSVCVCCQQETVLDLRDPDAS